MATQLEDTIDVGYCGLCHLPIASKAYLATLEGRWYALHKGCYFIAKTKRGADQNR